MLRESGAMPNAAPGAGLFGAPPNTNPSAAPAPGSTSSANPPFNPSLWPPFPQPNQAAGTGAGAGVGAQGTPAPAPGVGGGVVDPVLLQQLLGGLGGGGGGGLPGLGGLGGLGVPQQPADTRSTEERFQVQLQVSSITLPDYWFLRINLNTSQQLQDMGFVNASQNVRALLATGGNVHSAIEYILSGGGL